MEASLKDSIAPAYRYQLKSKMVLAGYITDTELAKQVQVDPARISRILNGWEYPSPKLAQKIAIAFGITLRELRELL